MALQHFFVGARHLGARQIPDTRCVPGLAVVFHWSHAFFCPKCGEIWGRLHHERGAYWQCTYRPCVKHGDGHLSQDWVPASYDVTYFEPSWPPAAIEYEFQRQLERAEREQVSE